MNFSDVEIMECPYCQNTSSRVIESRPTEAGQSIRRRRECLECKHRFTTYERIEFIPITVIKRDGSREPFNRSKILRGLIRACEKTDMTLSRLESIVDEIESDFQQSTSREITSHQIGLLVLYYLRQENEVAYIRFASVYGKFQGIKDFVATLNHLQEVKEKSHKLTDWHQLESMKAELLDSSSLIRFS